MNIGPFVIKINNRKILTGFLASLKLEKKSAEVLRVVDKLEKIGKDKVSEMLSAEKISPEQIQKIFDFVSISGTNSEILNALKKLPIRESEFVEGVDDLTTVINFLDLFNIPKDYYQIDLKIVRGLDYYTGTVYETFSIDYPEFGSICSGGRYDNLADAYTDKKLPGVGISIGLTRLYSQLREKGIINTKTQSVADVIIIPLVEDMTVPVKLSNTLRRKNVKAEIFLEDVPMKKKMNYANKKGVEYILLVGEDEIRSGKYTLKNMKNGEQVTVPESEIAGLINSLNYKNL